MERLKLYVPRSIGSVVCLVTLVAAAGCSRAMLEPMPEVKGRVAIKVSSDVPNGSDLGVGAHRIPNTLVYVTGYFTDAMQTGQYFGALGMIAAEGSAKSTAEKKTAHLTPLRLDMAGAAQRVVADRVARADSNRFAAANADATIEITPYLVVTSTGDDRMRPWVFVKTVLKDNGGAEKWKTRYMVSLGEPRPLEGPNGWVTGDGSSLRSAVDQGLHTAIGLLMRDASGTLPRHTGHDVKIKTQWPWSKEPFEYGAEILEETPDKIIFVAKLIDGPASGVTVLERRSAQVTRNSK
jgi:hypothetical protein